MIEGELALALFASVCILLLFGFPVALTLGGTALLFASFGVIAGHFDASFVAALSGRIFGTITNETLVAVPLFILMGVTLERAKIAEELLTAMANALGNRTGGLGMAVIIVGALLAASTGIVGATVVTMGVLALPSMLRAGYDPKLATGLICATGTLGQIIPPSIALVLLGDIVDGLSAGSTSERHHQYTNCLGWRSLCRLTRARYRTGRALSQLFALYRLAQSRKLPTTKGRCSNRGYECHRRDYPATCTDNHRARFDHPRGCDANRGRGCWCGRRDDLSGLQIRTQSDRYQRDRALHHGDHKYGFLDFDRGGALFSRL